MAYFRNNAVNLLNLHYGIHAMAQSGGGPFFIAYLLKAGVPVPGVLVALALMLAGRFVMRPIVLRFAPRFGMRPIVIAGTVICAIQFPFLATVHGLGLALWLICLLAALGDAVYWSTYHAYFAALGDHEHRGQQIGAREAISAVVGIASPLVTGGMLVAFGPTIAFSAAAFVLLLSALPILWTPNVAVAREAPGAFKAAIPGMLLFAADGWISAGFYFTWQIALFLSLGESFLAYGGALAAAAVVGALSGLVLGRSIDRGHGARAVWLALGLVAIIILLRAAAVDRAVLGVVANALGSLGACLYIPTLLTAVYNRAKCAPCPLRFQLAAEGGWDIGGAGGSLLAALLIGFGVPLSAGILLSLFGVVGAFFLLRRHYAPQPDESQGPLLSPPAASPG
jgi:hypothetical protein